MTIPLFAKIKVAFLTDIEVDKKKIRIANNLLFEAYKNLNDTIVIRYVDLNEWDSREQQCMPRDFVFVLFNVNEKKLEFESFCNKLSADTTVISDFSDETNILYKLKSII